MMSTINTIYSAALLHDIGKFIERAKDPAWQNEVKKYLIRKEVSKNHAHRRYSALFVEKFKDKKSFLNDSIEELVLHHHEDNRNEVEQFLSINDRGVLQKIIRIADDLAASERRENPELEPVDYYLARLHSPFQDIQLRINDSIYKLENNYYLNNHKLTIGKKAFFPNNEMIDNTNAYPNLVEDFLTEFQNIEDDEALLFLMEKYLVNVPAQTPVEINGKEILFKPDINLFDHSRSVAAIAVCLYLEYENGSWKGKDHQILSNNYKNENLNPPIILINGNISGIQDFIFNVKSEKAAQKLKGKSFFIQLLSDVVVKYFIESLGLKPANVLYNGGGNFFILAPAHTEEKLDQLKKSVFNVLKDLDLFISFGHVKVGLNDFSDFSNVFSSVTKETNKNKQLKFKQLNWDLVFEPTSQRLNEDEYYKSLTEELVCREMLIRKFREGEKISYYQKPFAKLGYSVDFYPQKSEISHESIVFNTTEFSNNYKGFRFAVKDLPRWNEKEKNKFLELNTLNKNKFKIDGEDEIIINSIISFERLAQFAYFETGTQKLGVLKMDIDNLGKLFSEGLPKEFEYKTKTGEIKKESLRTISRIAALSRAIKWFFEGYVNTLLDLPEYKNRIYPVFSGGDDFFVVGSWNKVFNFAEKVRNDFREFVCHHTGITLSAALLVVDDKFPVSRFAAIADERLHQAKYQSENKNSINVFDTVISWDDFHQAKLLKDKLVELVNKTGKRAVIEKIRKSTKDFEKIKSKAEIGKVELKKVWRLSYYLRDMVNPKHKDKLNIEIKNTVEEIVRQYEELVFNALKGESFSIKIFPVAARWAEFETRIKINKED